MLEIILLIFFFLSLPHLRSLGYIQPPIPGHPGSVGHGLSLVWAVRAVLADHSPMFCVSIFPVHLVGRIDYMLKVLWLAWCPLFTSGSLAWLERIFDFGSDSSITRSLAGVTLIEH